MTTYKVSELEGKNLDLAVAICEHVNIVIRPWGIATEHEFEPEGPAHEYDMRAWKMWLRYGPSQDWEIGGPIIEREFLGVMPISDASWRAGDVDGANGYGQTPLVAAMRCYVQSKRGDTVELP